MLQLTHMHMQTQKHTRTHIYTHMHAYNRVASQKIREKMAWDSRYHELLAFRCMHGHVRVPQHRYVYMYVYMFVCENVLVCMCACTCVEMHG
jgi:hypothetical protein